MAVTLGGSAGITFPDASNTSAANVSAQFSPYITDTANVMTIQNGVKVIGSTGIQTPLGTFTAARITANITIASDTANYLLNTVIKLRNKMKAEQLRDAKYKLIREVKKHYALEEFFKTNLSEYKVYASIYRVFEGVSIAKVSEVVQSRYTIVEHLTRKNQKATETKQEIVENYLEQDEEVRLLAYKLMIDKFNEKYAGLSQTQKNILKEYINNISNTTTLKAFLVKESKNVDVLLAKIIPTVKDQITAIKLKEVRNILAKFEKIKTIKEEHVLSLLLYHELLKELKNAKQKA